MQTLYILQQIVYRNQTKASESQQEYYNAHATAHRFQVGDLVRLYRPTPEEKGVGGKLTYAWKGPYRIAQVLGPVTYRLIDSNGRLMAGTAHSRYLSKTIA